MDRIIAEQSNGVDVLCPLVAKTTRPLNCLKHTLVIVGAGRSHVQLIEARDQASQE